MGVHSQNVRLFGVSFTVFVVACSFKGGEPTSSPDAEPQGDDADAAVDAAIDAAPNNAFVRAITIDAQATISTTVDNIAVPIRLTGDTHFQTNASAMGADLQVTGAMGVQLPIDIELLNVATGDLLLWVVVPKIGPANPAELLLYYGSEQTAPVIEANPWSAIADVVWHFEEVGTLPITTLDASANNMSGTDLGNGSLSAATGLHGIGFDFTDAVIRVQTNEDLGRGAADSSTTSIWFNQQTTNNDFDFAFFNGGPSAGRTGYEIPLGLGDWEAGIQDTNGNSVGLIYGTEAALGDQGWHQLVLTIDRASNTASAYLDGQPQDEVDITGIGDLRNNELARVGGVNSPPDGLFDEFRAHPFAVSADYVALDHALGSAPSIMKVSPASPVRYPGT